MTTARGDVTDAVLATIRSRRVVRALTDEPVDPAQLETVLDAARWSPTAGNRHLQRFAATTDPGVLRVLRMVSPGMIQRPTAAVAVCIDRPRALAFGFPPGAPGLLVDVGRRPRRRSWPRTRSGWAPAPSPRSAARRSRRCWHCRTAGHPS